MQVQYVFQLYAYDETNLRLSLLRYSPIYFDNLWYLKQTPKTHVEFSNKTSLFLLPASCSI